MNIAPISEPKTMMPGAGRDPEDAAGRRRRGRRAGSCARRWRMTKTISAATAMTASASTSVALVRDGREVDAPGSAPPTSTIERMPPRLSTGSVVSLTCAGTKKKASTSATTASGSVIRKTEPHQKCSRSRPGEQRPERGDRAAEARPERDRLRAAGARPQRGDQRQRRRVGHAGREAAEEAGDEQDAVRRRIGGEQATRGSPAHVPRMQHQLAPVAVAERARGRAPTRRGRASSRPRSG